jgi:hypothetical protein
MFLVPVVRLEPILCNGSALARFNIWINGPDLWLQAQPQPTQTLKLPFVIPPMQGPKEHPNLLSTYVMVSG